MAGTRVRQALFVIVLAVVATEATGQGPPSAKEMYAARCAFCHGPDGKGDGPTGASLRPPPTNFSNPEFWKTATTESVSQAIVAGKPQTAMMPFGSMLSTGEVDALVAYLKTFAPSSAPGGN